ncbi:methyl-accepting chemotaxis protein [Fundidesulfovibrio terrae]|uniref:methyl-accepting chemotaxis protein n=1 Tax=Fundidesulfovibrio terrae TaxID=2922866 RepID=UPI001FAEEAB8|nr:methyl-accepting chemotaxis protein [Fundidesulfovibrio terrae]
MSFFNNLSIFFKLACGFALTLILTTVLGASGYGSLMSIHDASGEVAEVWLPAMGATALMEQAANDFRRAEFRHILAATADERKQAEQRMSKAKATLAKQEAELSKLALPEEFRASFKAYMTAWQEFLPINAKVLELSNDNLGRDATLLVRGDSSKVFNEALAALDKISATAKERGLKGGDIVDASVQSAKMRTIIIGVAVLLLGLGVTLALPRLITTRLRATQRLAEEVASGKLDSCIESDSTDEIGLLQKALMDMLCKLKEQLAFSDGVLRGFTVPCSVFSAQDTTLYTNQLMLDLLERSGKPEDYYGQTSGGYIWGEPGKDTISSIALRENRSITAEREFATHKGNKRHARISSSPMYSENGQILGTLSVWIDLTEIKQQEALIGEQNEKIMSVAAQAEQVAEAVSSASEELSAQIEQAARGATIQKDRAAETATAMEEMNSTVLEVAQNAHAAANRSDQARVKAQDGKGVVDNVMNSMEDVRAQALTLRERMSSLEGRAQNIGRIMNVISDIADQTNLLALNAAIEAARAGEAGRGFAVVADEVRKLAEKTMAATHEVEEAITGIQREAKDNMTSVDQTAKAVEKVTSLAGESGQALETIVSLSDSATMEVHAIATASEQQSAASEEINRAVAEINRISNETAQAMTHSSDAVGDLARQAARLQELISGMQADEGRQAALGA